MDITLFIKGCLIGASVAAPIGPICLLCVRQAASYGFLAGVCAGLGAASADFIFAAGAAIGLTAINSWIMENQFLFNVAGGIFLAYLALKIMRTKINPKEAAQKHMGYFQGFSLVFVMTFLSPMTAFLFIAMFASYGVETAALSSLDMFSISLGTFVGSGLWWVFVAFMIARVVQLQKEIQLKDMLRPKVSLKKMLLYLIWPEVRRTQKLAIFQIINRIAGIIIAFYALITFFKAF